MLGILKSIINFAVNNPALVQGIYYVPAGLWPLVHMNSFLKVTGPKTDLWLVNTVGLLITVMGGVLIAARKKPFFEFFFLGAGSAAALAAIEIVYVSKRVISPVYLLDTFIEFYLIACWTIQFAFKPGASPARQ